MPNFGSGTVSAIATATNTVAATITTGAGPVNAAIDSTGATAYVTNRTANTVSVIDTATNTVSATLTGYSAPRGIVVVDVEQPVVGGLSPTSGPSTGGTSVTITGTGFTGVTSVKFGTTAATSFTVVSDTQITATTPAHAPATVDVTVSKTAGTSATSAASQYTYLTVADLAPSP